jgi:hypothetical protein
MDEKEAARAAVREFLGTRRDRITPADVGLPTTGTRRRVKGLRREEVALLAGVSPEYYIRLERGQATGPSAVKDAVRPGIRVLLDSIEHLPAVVFSSRLDVLAVNDLGRALYGPMFDSEGPVNSARFLFLAEPAARHLFPEWERLADDTVSILRIEAGRRPEDPALIALVGQLSTCSQAFRVRWAAHDVKAHRAGAKMFRHPLLGELTLPFENLTVDAAGDQVLTVFTPQPGSPEHDAIRMLASWNVSIPEDAESSSDI